MPSVCTHGCTGNGSGPSRTTRSSRMGGPARPRFSTRLCETLRPNRKRTLRRSAASIGARRRRFRAAAPLLRRQGREGKPASATSASGLALNRVLDLVELVLDLIELGEDLVQQVRGHLGVVEVLARGL